MNPNRRPTLKSIGAAAGVDPSTVSRALRGEPGSRIPLETMERIRKAADALGYEANPWARSLRTQRVMLLGLAVPRLTDIVLGQMFEAAQESARTHGYETITVSGNDEEGQTQTSIRELIERRVDGLILATATLDSSPLERLDADGVPFVLLNRASGSFPVVRGDDELGGYKATRHLLECGHRRIGHITGPQFASTSSLRLRGYRRALDEFGVEFDPNLVEVAGFDTLSALAVTDHMLETARPTAIFCVNDACAIAVLASAKKHGLQVPDDLAIVGYNDTQLASLLPIPLSTLSIPLQEMGRLAVDKLIDLIEGRAVESTVIEPELIIRESSATSR